MCYRRKTTVQMMRHLPMSRRLVVTRITARLR